MKTIFEDEDEAIKAYDDFYGYNIHCLSDEEIQALNEGKVVVMPSQDEYFMILRKER